MHSRRPFVYILPLFGFELPSHWLVDNVCFNEKDMPPLAFCLCMFRFLLTRITYSYEGGP